MDPQVLLEIIWNNIRNNDNRLRSAAEYQLHVLYSQSPDQLANSFLDILEIPYEYSNSSSRSSDQLRQVKKFVIVQLNNSISRHPRPPYINIWPKIQLETQKRIKSSFFELLKAEDSLFMMEKLAGSLGRLAANLIIHDQADWPQFKQLLLDVFLKFSEEGVQYGFYILQSFYEEEITNFKEIIPQIYSLLETGLQFYSNKSILLGALNCFKAYLKVLDHKDHPKFQQLIPSIFESIKHKINPGLITLSDMLEIEPRFFKPYFNQMVNFAIELYKQDKLTFGEREIIIEILVDYCRTYPSLFRRNSEYIPSLFFMLVNHMLTIKMEITENWKTPEEGFEENSQHDIPGSLIRNGMDFINSIIRELGPDLTLTHIEAILQDLKASNNCIILYNALMIMGILGEHMNKIEEVQKYLKDVETALDHEHPMIRYAGSHAIGLFSDDLKPKFQQQYGTKLLHKLKVRLQIQTIPRVVAHLQGALCNLIDSASFDLILPHFEDLVKISLSNANSGISLVKDTAMNLLTHLVEISHQRFEPYLEDLFELVNKYFNSDQYNKPCYNNLRGSALETMGFICTELPRDSFQPYVNSFIQLLMRIPQMPASEQPPLQKILNTWHKLSILYSEELQQSIDYFLPQLFQTLQSCISDGISENYPPFKKQEHQEDDSDNQENNENSSQNQEAQKQYQSNLISEGIFMIKSFSRSVPSLSHRYLQDTMNIFSNLIRNYPDEQVKENACNAIPQIIKDILQEDVRVEAAKKIISDLLISFESERGDYTSDKKIEAIHHIIEDLNYRFFTLEDLHILTDKLMYHLDLSEKQKTQFFVEVQELDQDQCENAKIKFEIEESIQFKIVETFGDIFKIYKDSSYYLARQILDSVLIDLFLNSQREKSIMAAIFLIDDMIEHLGYQLMSKEWPSFQQILRNHLTKQSSCPIRQASAYGLGMLAKKTPHQLRNSQVALNWLQILNDILNVQKKKKEKLASFLYARDNVVAAIGKILKTHLHLIDIKPFLATWLMYLPIKKDRSQSEEQTEFLIELILENFQLVFSDNLMQRFIRLMNIFGEILKDKLIPQNSRQNIYGVIQKLVLNEFFRKNMDVIMKNIQDCHREAIWAFIQS